MILHQSQLSGSGNRFQAEIQRAERWDFHFHKNCEIIYVIGGEVECSINNRTEILHSGEFGMCLSNEIHCGHCIGDAVFWVCIFSEDMVRDFAKAVEGKEGDGFRFCCSEPLRNYFESVFLNSAAPDLFEQKALLYALCGEYLKQVELIEKSKTRMGGMSEIVDYISANYRSNIRLSDIAEFLNYDYHYVSRLFKTLFNMSFNSFVNVYRLEKAIELLQAEDKKLVDIAYESGFQSVRSFNASFKKYFGVTPTEYKGKMV